MSDLKGKTLQRIPQMKMKNVISDMEHVMLNDIIVESVI